jgi:hypothetical protein
MRTVIPPFVQIIQILFLNERWHHFHRTGSGPNRCAGWSRYLRPRISLGTECLADRQPTPLAPPEDWLALFGEGIQALNIVAAVVCFPAQGLDPLVHLRGDGLVVRQDSKLFLDDRDRQR